MRSLRGLTIGVIGAGRMGQALVGGLRANSVPSASMVVADVSSRALRQVRRRWGVRVTDHNVDAVRRADLVVLAVKPQQVPEVVQQIAPHLRRSTLVVSIAAGITLKWLGSRLRNVPLARVMPNLPATVGCGFAAVTFSSNAAPRHRAIVRALFEAVGTVVELPERSFDAITAVSGSGPAYVFFLVDAWQKAARSLGLSEGVAAHAIAHTLEGSVRLLKASADDAATLMGKVASKGGTTDAALRVLAARHVASSFAEALKAAARRSTQLSWTS